MTVRGGRRLRRFIFTFERVSTEAIIFALRDVIRTVILPQLKSEVPVRTGRLRDGLRMVVHRGFIEIRGPFYGRFQRINGDTIAERVVDLINRNATQIHALVRQYVRARI